MPLWPLVFIVFAAGAVAAVTWPLWARSARTDAPRRAAHEVAAERRALAEVERDAARGALRPEEAEAARREIGRRLIAASDRLEAEAPFEPAPRDAAQTGAAAIGFAALAIAIGFYVGIGSPGASDAPLSQRDLSAEAREGQLDQASAEARRLAETGGAAAPIDAETEALFARMRVAIVQRPSDPEGRALLAGALRNAGRPEEAWPLFLEAAELTRAPTQEAAQAAVRLRSEAGQAMVAAAGGYVSREAEDLFEALRPEPIAVYFVGLAHAQRAQLPEAYGLWTALLADHPDAPFAPLLAEQAAALADALQVPLAERPAVLIAAPAGVDPDAAAAVAAMSPEERRAFMSDRADALAERLAEEPDDLDGWAMLIRSYARLGRDAEALAAYDRAAAIFADDFEAMAALRAQAQDIGVDLDAPR